MSKRKELDRDIYRGLYELELELMRLHPGMTREQTRNRIASFVMRDLGVDSTMIRKQLKGTVTMGATKQFEIEQAETE